MEVLEQPKPAEAAKEQAKPAEEAKNLPKQPRPAMSDINQVRVSVVLNAVAAIAMGWASVILTSMSRTIVAGVAGIVIMLIVGFITQKVTKNSNRKWWASNGVLIFLLVWLVSWTTFKNIGV